MDINKLIKLAKSYDTVGLYHEADQILIKMAQDNQAVYVPPTSARSFYDRKTDKFLFYIYPGKFNYTNDNEDKRYERFNHYSTRINGAPDANYLKNVLNSITNDTNKIGDNTYGKYTLSNFINQILQTNPSFNVKNYESSVVNFQPGQKGAIDRNEISVIAQNESGGPSVSFGTGTKSEAGSGSTSETKSEIGAVSGKGSTLGTPAVKPLAAPKNQVELAQPIIDVNPYEFNLNRQRRQETNQDALRSEWNGYIQGDSFLQSLQSRLKDIHNEVNPTNKSDVFNEGMIETIKGSKDAAKYKPLIDMYNARKDKTYQNVGDLGPAQMYGTR